MLRPDPTGDLWGYWARGAGINGLDASADDYFQTFDHLYRATLQGLGVGIGARCFVQEDLDSGRLIAPFEISVRFPTPNCLVIPKWKAERPNVTRFRDWILRQATGRGLDQSPARAASAAMG